MGSLAGRTKGACGPSTPRHGLSARNWLKPSKMTACADFGRRIVFLEQPDALKPELRQGLEAWLGNRLHGREGVEAGRTIPDALADLEGIKVDETNSFALQEIRHWLENIGAE